MATTVALRNNTVFWTMMCPKGGYTERAVRPEKKREGSNFGGENETPSCAVCDFGARELYVDGRRSGSYSTNMCNEQSGYYRQASRK
jgi:hypothetical protein